MGGGRCCEHAKIRVEMMFLLILHFRVKVTQLPVRLVTSPHYAFNVEVVIITIGA